MVRILKIVGIILVTLATVPLQLIWTLIPGLRKRFWIIPRFWHRCVMRIMGVHITVKGKKNLPRNKNVLYVSNHCSYIDIMVLGTFLSGAFISKSDVAHWPVFGFLAKLQGTFFIHRQAKFAREQKKELTRLAQNGTNFMLFPEGTTTDGTYVMPFKSSLFGVATDLGIDVQPVAVRYKTINSKPFGADNKARIAWYIDKETGYDPDLAPHLWDALALKSVEVEIQILPVISTAQFSHRKDLANHSQSMVSKAFAA